VASELSARSALVGADTPGRYGARREGAPAVTISVRPGLALAMITARKDKGAQVIAALTQVHPTDSPSRAAQGDITLIGCAPGQWLAVAEASRAAGFVAELTLALGALASVTDHTSAKTVVRISGPRARDALTKGCPVDLHPRALQPGGTATTRMAQIGVTFWQVDTTPTFDLAVNSSIARSLWTWLANSAAEYGYQVAASK